jgi:SM-20-related protein
MPTTSVDCKILNLDAIRQMPLKREPFQYCIIPNSLDPNSMKSIQSSFPPISTTGSYPISRVEYGAAFKQLVDELQSKEFEKAIAEKFDLELAGLPQMLTVRGWCGWKADGHIHTDSKDKVITVLLYLNEEWNQEGGKLRLLGSKNLDDVAAEVPPTFGHLLLFRRCDWSWHGHYPCEGERRSMQLNWIKSERYGKFEAFRHTVSSLFKKNAKSGDQSYYNE